MVKKKKPRRIQLLGSFFDERSFVGERELQELQGMNLIYMLCFLTLFKPGVGRCVFLLFFFFGGFFLVFVV